MRILEVLGLIKTIIIIVLVLSVWQYLSHQPVIGKALPSPKEAIKGGFNELFGDYYQKAKAWAYEFCMKTHLCSYVIECDPRLEGTYLASQNCPEGYVCVSSAESSLGGYCRRVEK